MHISAKHSAPSRVTFNKSSGPGVLAFRDCLAHTVSAPIMRGVTVAVLSRYQAGECEPSPERVPLNAEKAARGTVARQVHMKNEEKL